MVTYQVTVQTSKNPISPSDTAGTDSTIYISLTGTNGTTRPVPLPDKFFINEFEPGRIDTYSVTFDRRVGRITAIDVHTDGSGSDPAWRLSEIHVNGQRFPANDHVLSGLNNFHVRLNANGPVVAVPVAPEGMRPVSVVVKTATWKMHKGIPIGDGAGTDAKVYLRIFGSKGSSKEVRLDKTLSGDPFNQGDQDEFPMVLNDFGYPRRLRLRSGGEGRYTHWGVTSVTVDGREFPTTDLILGPRRSLIGYISETGHEPRLGDIDPMNAVDLYNRPTDALLIWATENDRQASIVHDRFVPDPTRREKSLTHSFSEVLTSTATLFNMIKPLESGNADETALAQNLTKLIYDREDALKLFKRFRKYLSTMQVDLDEELEELKEAFTRGFQVEVDYIPAEISESAEMTQGLSMVFAIIGIIPNPLSAAISTVSTTAVKLAEKYEQEGLGGPRVTSEVSGGRAQLLEVIDDEFFHLGKESGRLVDVLEKTSLRSYAMIRECADFEQAIADAVRTVPPSQEGDIVREYFPSEARLPEILKPFWTRMLLAEAVLVGTDINEVSDSDMGFIAASNSNSPRFYSTAWRIALRGKDASEPDDTTNFTQAALRRLHWIYSAQELTRIMINANLAYRFIRQDRFEPNALGIAKHEQIEEWVLLDRLDGGGFGVEDIEFERQEFWEFHVRKSIRLDSGDFQVEPLALQRGTFRF